VKVSRPEAYYAAALERLGAADLLRKQGRYVFSMYASGLAAECMLRAYWPAETPFDARHDMKEILKACEIPLGDKARRKLWGDVQEIHGIWHNNYRFADDATVRAHLLALGDVGRRRHRRADLLKVRCEDLWNAANSVIQVGISKWQPRR
jgi:hypothetical protein